MPPFFFRNGGFFRFLEKNNKNCDFIFVFSKTIHIFAIEISLNSATLLIVSGHCGQNRPECDFSCSNWLFAMS